VVKTEVTQNPEVIRALIANAVRRITDKENVRVRVSVADAPHVKEMRQEILELMDGLRHLEIVDDRRVGDGGCVIETNAGTIDAKIETQLSEIARALGVAEND
jgi:flagellar assembly protein FliH